MAERPASLTRGPSTSSSASSNIDVEMKDSYHSAAADSESVSRVSASTPPTSLGDSGSLGGSSTKIKFRKDALDEADEDNDSSETRTIRPRRSRSSNISSYNLKKLSDAQLSLINVATKRMATASSCRNSPGLTGRMLIAGDGAVNDEEPEAGASFDKTFDHAMNMHSRLSATSTAPQSSPRGRGVQRRLSVRDRLKKAAGKAASVLGKRSRDAVEAGKRTLGMVATGKDEAENVRRRKLLKELDTGPKGVLDEIDLDAEFPAPRPTKKVKMSSDSKVAKEMPNLLPKAAIAGKRMKKWQKEGLFVGQQDSQSGSKKKFQKKQPDSSASDPSENATTPAAPTARSFLPLPMFSLLDKDRDFIIPYDVFAPSLKKGDEKPKDWNVINKNRLVGEAKELWERTERLPVSMCVCDPPRDGELSCGEQCLNHIMQYECNDENCNVKADQCGNRSFAELAKRVKKNGAFDIGVEVLKTPNRGFGVRSCRTFAPGQIIMEYTGEIISEGECQRRMRELYMNKPCYYLMELERGLVIDGTKGSMARFINHSCAPNCEVRMVKVNGTPRMGVFAGEDGIVTGEELTYDYNFDNFGAARQQCFCGASTCRGFLSKRLNATEQKKLAKDESEKKRKAAEEAVKHAEDEERKKKSKTDRGASWRGWVAVDDPETKERLRQEKKARDEAEKNSTRAKRLAARRGSLPAAVEEKSALVRKKESGRRKTTTTAELTAVVTKEDTAEENLSWAATTRMKHARTGSPSSSKFHEDLTPRPSSFRRKIAGAATTQHQLQSELSDAILGAEDDEEKKSEPKQSTTASTTKRHESKPLEPEAGKGKKKNRSSALLDVNVKDVIKSIGASVRNGISGAGSNEGGMAGSIGSGEKLKQSTLNFAKLG